MSEKLSGRLVNIGVSLIAALVFLTAAEAGLRFWYPRTADYNLEMWRYAAYGKIPLDGMGMSHRHRPGASFRDLYGVPVKINSRGLRDYEYGYEKPAGCRRILVIGDSITFGWGVALEKTYAKLLEERLNRENGPGKWQVINAGVGNYQMRDELEFLKSEGLKYAPDLIVWGYFIDDAKINPVHRPGFLESHSYLYGFVLSRLNAIRVKARDGLRYDRYYRGLYEPGSLTRKGLEGGIRELKGIVAERKIPLLVALLPELHQLAGYPFQKEYDYVAGLLAGQNGVMTVDLLPFFDARRPPEDYWVSREDQHHNARAQAVIADALYPRVLALMNGSMQEVPR